MTPKRGRHRRANRVELEKKLGRPLLPGMWALHHCDNPICVEWEHLYEGTPQDNDRDKRTRGRHHNQRKSVCGRCGGADFRITPAGRRKCRDCERDHIRASRARRP